MADLPTNIEASYGDRSAGDRVHQQHHDQIHAFVNSAGAPDGVATLDAAGLLPETQVPDRLTEPALSATFGYSGTGSPEGVVTAPVGSRYADEAATNGAILWVKATGTGSTGWKVAYADTGTRRVVAPGDIVGMPNMEIYARRIGAEITIEMVEKVAGGTASGTIPLWSLPVGWRPVAGTIASTDVFNSGGSLITGPRLRHLSISPFDIRLQGAIAGERHYGVLQYLTPDAWPTTLPGTAA